MKFINGAESATHPTTVGVLLSPKELTKIPDWEADVEYRWHPEDDHYAVGGNGAVYSRDYRGVEREKYLRIVLSRGRGGYLVFNNQRKNYRAHRFILETFVVAPSRRHHASHRNGCRQDNRKDNLMWLTAKENIAHKVLHGTYRYGVSHHESKLTDSKVVRIFGLRKRGLSWPQIARQVGCSLQTAWSVGTGRRHEATQRYIREA